MGVQLKERKGEIFELDGHWLKGKEWKTERKEENKWKKHEKALVGICHKYHDVLQCFPISFKTLFF